MTQNTNFNKIAFIDWLKIFVMPKHVFYDWFNVTTMSNMIKESNKNVFNN
jgi:hypothetical protein